MVTRRWLSPARSSARASSSTRPKARSVGSPPSASRKRADRRDRVSHCWRVRSRAAAPTSHMNTGTSGNVAASTRAESGSRAATAASRPAGTSTARATWGRHWAR